MGVNSGSGFVSSGSGGGITPAHIYANALFVDPNGDDVTAVKGDLHLPYATLGGALDNVVDGDVIVMFAGNYSVNYTIESRLTGTPEFSIISQGKVVITTSVTSFINDAVGHNYTINGDFDIIGHSGASIINISNANSSLQIRINKITQDGNFVIFGMTPQDYENMAYNLQELRRYIRQQKEIIIYYRDATKVEGQ